MKICVDMGHTKASTGASKYLDELTEDRKIGKALIAELQKRGHVVIDTTPADNIPYPTEINLRVNKANASGASLFVSVHLNAGGGTGTECLYFAGDRYGQEKAAKVSANVAALLGLSNRGAKPRTNEVGVIRDTIMTAILVEVCFVDSYKDARAYWNTTPEQIASAIADGIEGASTSGGASSSAGNGTTGAQLKPLGKIDVTYALRTTDGEWWPDVTNFNNTNADGYAGAPFATHNAFKATVTKGEILYKVHTRGGSWSKEFSNGEVATGKNGGTIDGVAIYYETPEGYDYQQAYYRSQTVDREGYLPVCCDYGTFSGYDGWAGNYGEALDRLQVAIADSNPF